MSRLKSTEISTFPSSTRTVTDVYSRFTTELNLTNLINRLADNECFVTKFEDGIIEFSMAGYYFQVNVNTLLNTFNVDDNIYAVIIVGYDGNEKAYDKRLVGYNGTVQRDVDMNNEFIGLQLFNSSTSKDTFIKGLSLSTNYKVYSLHLADINSSSFGKALTVPESSYRKFTNQTLGITTLTDDEINEIWSSY